MFRPQILACIALFAVAMVGVRLVAHGIVDNFGALAGFAVILAMIGAGAWYDKNQRPRP